MVQTPDGLFLSATDLANHLSCKHLTQLKLRVANGQLHKPESYNPSLQVLREKGAAFEESTLKKLQEDGCSIVVINKEKRAEALAQTRIAMENGVDVIYQARLESGKWQGWADFLLKVDTPGSLGGWSYEILDTKLALETRAGTILQLCLYSEILAEYQGVFPEYMHVKTPEEEIPYRVSDFMAYFRLVKRSLLNSISVQQDTYPTPVPHCDICDWWDICNTRRRTDDHLTFVAGMGNAQTKELITWGVPTLEALANLPLPIERQPSRGAKETFVRLREQARVQLQARVTQQNIFELLDFEPNKGLFNLPEPSLGDIFFDLEGDPYVGEKGLEYMFGWVFNDVYHVHWALTALEEKTIFELFIDFVLQAWDQYPDMHIYHFSPYEPSALKRLMGKYATRQDEVDRMLRAGLFVDLHSIVRQTLRAGIEKYSLKDLERFHVFNREMELRKASAHKAQFELLLESGTPDLTPADSLINIALYNEDDCRSTFSLRNWLEILREEQINRGFNIPRPELKDSEAGEELNEHIQRIRDLSNRLTTDLPFEKDERNDEQQANWLLAYLLEGYRRESKVTWWEFFRLNELEHDVLLGERAALSGLVFTGARELVRASVIDTYNFPIQECDLKNGNSLKAVGEGASFGSVHSIDLTAGWVRIKKGSAIINIHPTAVFNFDSISQKVKEDAVLRIGDWVADHGIDADGSYRAGRDLLLGVLPRVLEPFGRDANPQITAVNWVNVLGEGVLPIQGPPGTGKSFTAAKMILSLLQQGKKVGITALSHKVIRGLLDKVMQAAAEAGLDIQCVQKVNEFSEIGVEGLEETNSNPRVLQLLTEGEVQLAAATSFLWAREEFFETLDVLFVDEAGQLSLLDTLAVSHAAKSLVLLGDPQQLKQPLKGSHPEGTDVSALEHILQGHSTMPDDKGVFLGETWRLHPSICSFNSELSYEGKLYPREDLVNHRIEGKTPYAGSGLFYESVEHTGNQNSSEEEADRVGEIVRHLINEKIDWFNRHNDKRRLQLEDILIITPYNAQVAKIAERLPEAHIGTVDKFQGQEAPVVIISMATSTPEDAPRGMDFFYSLNRLNVAVSRAKAVCIMVACPKIFEPDCKSPAQIKLANGLCMYIEKTKKEY